MHNLIQELGTSTLGLYLTFKHLEYTSPKGVNEMSLLEHSGDGVKKNKIYLEKLIEKEYLMRNDNGFIISNKNKVF